MNTSGKTGLRSVGLAVTAVIALGACAADGPAELTPEAVAVQRPAACENAAATATASSVRSTLVAKRWRTDAASRRSLMTAGQRFADYRAGASTPEQAERFQNVVDDLQAFLAADRTDAAGLSDLQATLAARLDAVTKWCAAPR